MTPSPKSARKPVLAAIDLGPQSRKILHKAIELASEQERPVLALHIVHETVHSSGFYSRHNTSNVSRPMADIARELLDTLVTEVQTANGNGSASVKIVGMVVDGIPQTRIVEIAEKVDATAIVLVSREPTLLHRFWNGSVTENIRKQSQRPLVIMQSDQREVAAMPQEHTKNISNEVQLAH